VTRRALLHHYLVGISYECEIVQDIKEKALLCYVELDIDSEFESAQSDSYLDKPFNGYVIFIGKYCSRCPETHFQPVYLRQTSTGVHETCCNSVI